MTITSVNANLNAGQTTTLSFSVKNNNGGVLGGETSFNINVRGFNEVQCQGERCDFTDTIDLGATKSYSVTLRAGNVAAGQTRSGEIQITAQVGRDSESASRNITVRGPEAPPEVQTVSEVSGRVTNEETGEGISGASIRLTDGQGRTHNTTTSSNGNYQFRGSQERPIAPGRLQIRATKDGISDTKEVNGAAGAKVNGQGIQLALAAAPTATPEATVEPTEDAAEGDPTEEAGAEESQEAGAPDQAANEDSGGGLGSWVLILAGGLLVALGVGAIVLLLMRRKEDGSDDDEDGPGSPGPRGGVAAGRGGYDDATRVTNRAGADPTMVNRGGNLADAPTMMHSAPLVDDEFPDPYGAPLPGPQTPGYGAGQPGWGGNANGYGDAPGSGAGAGAYGNAPGSGAGYGAPASGAGYGNAPGSGAGYGAPVSGGGYSANGAGGYDDGYDEPTGRYTGARGGADEYGPAADPYDTNAYRPSSGAGHGGYEPTQQYGRDDDGYGAGGYGAGQAGYGDEPRTGAGYDRADAGYDQPGYDNRAGYDQQGYGADRTAYDQPTTGAGYDQPRGGYDDQNGYDDRAGYDQQHAGGYYDDAPRAGHSRSGAPQQSSRSERRSLDWLDD